MADACSKSATPRGDGCAPLAPSVAQMCTLGGQGNAQRRASAGRSGVGRR
eukprot:CAMPEP_0176130206 /NCGR_PEP_ID=MMETSP0120_2-20121206/65873_1 /TAXON_ID=160619 /ORGANISM="Kryptoperidinium foliaceum, Strain CCMP 1326" /LENGTH=49 /DNA_ID= /DNA_START= /DNA_END= /DNA_ORIENTATION=